MATELENSDLDSGPSQGFKTTPIPPPTLPSPSPTSHHPPTSLPQKRAMIDDDHTPAVGSPLNPDSKTSKASAKSQPEDGPALAREKRTKKESLKKRESKGALAGAEFSRATPEPRMKNAKTSEAVPLLVKLHGGIRGTDFEPIPPPVFKSHHEITDPSGSTIEFCETAEHPVNRKGYVYEYGIADPRFPSSLYLRQTDPYPHRARFSFEDAAPCVYFDETGNHITGDFGFRMARANVAARQGRWYWECKITRGCVKNKQPDDPESHGHVRMGWARREASRDAPVGYDAYSYGFRDVGGQKVHMSRPKDFFPAGENMEEGDVIGLEIQLPSENLHRKVVQGSYNPAVDMDDEEFGSSAEGPNIVRDRVPFRFQTKLCFEKIDYHTIKELEDAMNPSPMTSSGPTSLAEPPNPNHQVPCLRTLPNSHIKVYKNGVLVGTPFTDLLAFLPPASSANPKLQEGARERLDDGMLGYYPAVSVFRGGAAEVNFGPNFWYPPPGFEAASEDVVMIDTGTSPQAAGNSLTKLTAVSERYAEQIAEDVVWDIIDEVHFWAQTGGKDLERTGLAREESKDKDVTMED